MTDDRTLRARSGALGHLFGTLHDIREAAVVDRDLRTLRMLSTRAGLLEEAALDDLLALEGDDDQFRERPGI